MTEEQKAMLMARFADTRTAVLAREMGVSYRTVCHWAADLGLKKDKDFRTAMSAIAGTKIRCKGCKKKDFISFNDDKEAYMRRHFATTPNKVLAGILGVNERTIRRWASSLGLVKDREVMVLHRRCMIAPTPEKWFYTVATVRELYPDGRDEEITERTGYKHAHIGRIARRYGIERSEAYRQRMKENRRQVLARTMAAKRETKSTRTLALEAEIRRSYADTPTPVIAERLGISNIYVKVIAVRLGLRKSKEFVSRTRSEVNKSWHARQKKEAR